MVVPVTVLDAWEENGGQGKRKPSFIEFNQMPYKDEALEDGDKDGDKEITADKNSRPVEVFMLEAKLAWASFYDNTSAHGVPHVGRSRGAARTIFWLIALVVMIALILQTSWNLYMKYALYDVTVTTKVVSNRKLAFPAVTICNMNTIKLDALRHNEKVRRVVFPGGGSPTPAVVPGSNHHGIDIASNAEEKKRVARSAQKSTKNKFTGRSTTSKLSSMTASTLTSESDLSTERTATTQLPQQTVSLATDMKPSPEMTTSTRLTPRETMLSRTKDETNPASDKTVSENKPRDATLSHQNKTSPAEKLPKQETTSSASVSELGELVKNDTQTLATPQKRERKQTEPDMKGSTTQQRPITPSNKIPAPEKSLMVQKGTTPSNTNTQGQITEADKLETTLKEKILEVMAEIPLETKKALGYEVDEMIVKCTYAGSNCNVSTDFVHTYDENNGNCYSLNWKDTAPLVSSQSGPQHGLELLLNVGQEQYTRGLVDGMGMRVVLHTQSNMPFPNDGGLLIPTGQLTYVGIKRKEMTRLGGNYGTCIPEGQSDPSRNIYEELYAAGYTINGCLKTCFQQHVMSECGCANPALPIPNDAFNTTLTICSYSEKDSCFREKLEAFYNSNLQCDCPLPCNEVTYEQTVSAVPWPAMIHDDDLKNTLREALGNQEYSRIFPQYSDSLLADNLAKLVIYYDEFLVQKSTEQPAYGSNEILPDIGGILGLYAGVSVITALELGELLFDICLAFTHALTRPLTTPKME